MHPVQIWAPFEVHTVPEAAVPPGQAQEFKMQEMPLKWKPTLQPVQIAAPLEVQDEPVTAVPPAQEQTFDAQAMPLKL